MNRSYLALFPSTWPPCRVCRGRGRDAEGRGGKPEERETSVLVVGPSLGEEHPPGFAPLVHAEGEQEVERGAGGGTPAHRHRLLLTCTHELHAAHEGRRSVCVLGQGRGRGSTNGGGRRAGVAVADLQLPVPSLESYVVDDDGRLPAPTVQQQGICTEEVAKHFHVDGGRSSSATSAALPSFTGGDRAQGERGGTYCLTKRPPSVSLSCSDEVGRWRMGVGRRIATCRLGAIALEYHEGQNKGSAPRPCRKLALPPPADHNPG